MALSLKGWMLLSCGIAFSLFVVKEWVNKDAFLSLGLRRTELPTRCLPETEGIPHVSSQSSVETASPTPPHPTTTRTCHKDGIFNEILLVIMYSIPKYDTVSLLKEFYSPAFKDFYICGEEANATHDIHKIVSRHSIWGYRCLINAIVHRPTYSGYLFINDDLIINWWNLISKYRLDRVWQSSNYFGFVDADGEIPEGWWWWISPYGFKNSLRAIDKIRAERASHPHFHDAYKTFLHNGEGRRLFHYGRSDVVYIPRKVSHLFAELGQIFYDKGVVIEIAVPTILRLLVEQNDMEHMNGYYIPGNVLKNDSRVTDSRFFWVSYFKHMKLDFIHPFKLHHKGFHNSELSIELMKRIMIRTSEDHAACRI